MEAMVFLVSTVFKIYLMLVILRFWLQTVRADFYNPISQMVVKATNPVLIPLRRVLPSIGRLDTASIVLALLVSALYMATVFFIKTGYLPLMAIFVTAFSTLIFEVLDLMFYLMLLTALLSWFSQGRSPVEYLMRQLTEPLLSPIRKVLPALGPVDLSVMVFLIGLQFFKILLSGFLPVAL